MRGTLLNTATVAGGAALGLAIGRAIPPGYQDVALHGLGLVTMGLSVRMLLKGRNPLIAAVAVAVGGVLGLALGIHVGIEHLAEWTRSQVGGDASRFVQGVVTSFVLFCVGPMTLLGCLEDALEGKIDLLSVKSTLDGIAAVFLAAALGAGVLLTAGLLLLFQGAITLAARPLRKIARDEGALDEISGTGGAILLATGIGLVGLKDLHPANYLPAVFLAPVIALAARRLSREAGNL
jgi:uncharacterized membrane protein YqgA involved in biofilm formation